MKRQVQGVFVRDSEDNPVALFSDPRAARAEAAARGGVVAPLEVTISAESLRNTWEAIDDAAAPEGGAAAVDPERERIRAEVIKERREARIRAEVEEELDDDDGEPTVAKPRAQRRKG